MTPRLPGLLAALLALSAPAPAAEVTLEDVLASRPAPAGYPVDGVTLRRDVLTVRLESGAFFPLAEAGGRVLGGVFLGRGTFELDPASEAERHNLAVRARKKDLRKLETPFRSAAFLFSDGTFEELTRGRQPSAKGDPLPVYEKLLKKERKELRINLHIRLFADTLEGRPVGEGLFAVYLDGEDLPPALALYDPRGLPAAGFAHEMGTETTALVVLDDNRGGTWYAHVPRGKAGPFAASLDADAAHYEIDTRIRKNRDVDATVAIRFRCNRAGTRVLRPILFPRLRVKEAALEPQGGEREPATYRQGQPDEDGDLAVVLLRPLDAGEETTLRLSYAGDEVLDDNGGGNYAVNARTSWYPNFGTFSDTAVYDLTYRVPRKNQVVSVGEPAGVEAGSDGTVYRFKTRAPIRVAGFNYGDFRKQERKDGDSGFAIAVYTNKDDSALTRELEESQAVVGRIQPGQYAESALVDGINAARVGTAYFGALPDPHVSITQQTAWTFGQSWPSLIFLPFIAFLSSTHRAQLGLLDATSFVYNVGYHELAHQWWGHHVGWATYRDQWLSEGFAEFSAGLAVQHTQGPKKMADFWESSRKHLLEKGRGSWRAWEASSIDMGYRAASPEAPDGAQKLIYTKGAFVLQMLRTMLYDGKAASKDERFVALMKDFTSTWAGKAPTTDDFRGVVDRHLPPVGGSAGSEWFFRQWVHGRDIPRLTQRLELADAGGGRYRLHGEVRQSEVPEDFRSVIPIYIELEKDRMARVGQIVLLGTKPVAIDTELPLPGKPRRAVANAFSDWLTRD